ncbi:NAD(P)H-hydrate dehydratase [Pseudoflavonifractor sp. MSJ-37]|uniref:NAD(P)H-hydrate dehydratase n=1 Tax=Pseudoflavonifractor sp. MSJ-37 TaxID=2841531 RepID=UPI001C11D946|nr:NAD(P)H-hydrate dehydratase [Pseudoflavonifractor sp. MSJ-37]MBU5434746.1 NAD(P)H-hydrate dehydratase [Pseudoflavonifractor sp. MSJ-37]
MKIATARQMREMDRAAIQDRGIDSTRLMENAAQAVAEAAFLAAQTRPEREGRIRRAICFCGAGNNGGDGVAAARQLLERGMEVRAVLVGRREKMTPDNREMERRLESVGGHLEDFRPEDPAFVQWCLDADVMVDALFGIGLNTDLRGDSLTAVQMMNTCDIPVVSADIASGVEADTGRILGDAVRADVTVTFSLAKAGHFLGKGDLCTGRLIVTEIGIPLDLVHGVESGLYSVCGNDVRLPERPRESHKGDFGRDVIIGGAMGYTGAPVLAARAAVRSGAGLVSLGVPEPIWPIVAAKLETAMPRALPAGADGMLTLAGIDQAEAMLRPADACLIGPGLGRDSETAELVRRLLRTTAAPVVLDADGINALEGHIDVLEERRGRVTILTPHDGEFARLGGDLSGGDRLSAARERSRRLDCCIVLKGHRTITAFPDGTAYVNTTGNPGMAVGGSGDVLGGIILSLLGQGFPEREAVPMAVWIHGRAGDLCAETLGEYSMAPTDLIERLPQVLMECERRSRTL